MKKLTREQVLDLRNSFGVWQQYYDPEHDKEQHDMFALGVVAMNEMLAAMDGEDAERREWMARGVDSVIDALCQSGALTVGDSIVAVVKHAAKIRSGEVEL